MDPLRSQPSPSRIDPSRRSVDCGVESGKLEAVQSMLERGLTPQLQGPDLSQQERLEARLSRVDRGVLRWAESRGVKLQVLQSGEELEARDPEKLLYGEG